ncbi:MAG: tetratricopeptide repeat protein, partial [Bryobacterales bacterium]|nr:tetratricopeptide repeat protein [Bryobacterales bacterium]
MKLADEHYAAKRYKDAILNYRSALQKNTSSGDAHYKLGRTFLDDGQIVEAFVTLNRAAELLPKHEDTRVKLGEIALAGLVTDPSRPQAFYDKLNKMADELLAIKPDHHQGLRFKGHLAQLDNKPSAEVLDLFRRANASKPMQGEVLVPLI